jgi:hypothetical protein
MSFVQTCLEINFTPKQFFCYVLQCEQNKYYIGITADIYRRLYQHFFLGGGSNFTATFKPIRVIEKNNIIHWCSTIGDKPYVYENQKTEEYILKYGKENVCGGKYCYSFKYAKKPQVTHYLIPYKDVEKYEQIKKILKEQKIL